jgi:hypothetical protein
MTVANRAGSTYTPLPRSRIKLLFDLYTLEVKEKDKPLRKPKPVIEEVYDYLSADKYLPHVYQERKQCH